MGKDEELILRNRLKFAKAEKNLTQEDLANLVGASRQTISSLKKGNLIPLQN